MRHILESKTGIKSSNKHKTAQLNFCISNPTAHISCAPVKFTHHNKASTNEYQSLEDFSIILIYSVILTPGLLHWVLFEI